MPERASFKKAPFAHMDIPSYVAGFTLSGRLFAWIIWIIEQWRLLVLVGHRLRHSSRDSPRGARPRLPRHRYGGRATPPRAHDRHRQRYAGLHDRRPVVASAFYMGEGPPHGRRARQGLAGAGYHQRQERQRHARHCRGRTNVPYRHHHLRLIPLAPETLCIR